MDVRKGCCLWTVVAPQPPANGGSSSTTSPGRIATSPGSAAPTGRSPTSTEHTATTSASRGRSACSDRTDGQHVGQRRTVRDRQLVGLDARRGARRGPVADRDGAHGWDGSGRAGRACSVSFLIAQGRQVSPTARSGASAAQRRAQIESGASAPCDRRCDEHPAAADEHDPALCRGAACARAAPAPGPDPARRGQRAARGPRGRPGAGRRPQGARPGARPVPADPHDGQRLPGAADRHRGRPVGRRGRLGHGRRRAVHLRPGRARGPTAAGRRAGWPRSATPTTPSRT